MALTAKQQRFVEEYLIDLNATQAAIRAGYSEKTARSIGQENLTKPDVAEAIQVAIDARSARTQITADRVLQEMGRVAFSDMRKFARWGAGGVTLLSSDKLSDDEARCVAEVYESTSKEGGAIKFKLHPKMDALEKLARHLGLYERALEDNEPPPQTIQFVTEDSEEAPFPDYGTEVH